MSKNGSQFIINLVKLPQGYAFQSFQQADNAASKKKNSSKDKPKNTPNRTVHRIFRELALDPQQPQGLLNPIPEESEPAPKQVEPEVQEEFSAIIKRQNGLPESPAKWFNQQSFHEIEKQALPQFFNGKTYKTPTLYQKLRNFIVTLYRKNPTEYLTKIACRRILKGDVNMIMKIHSFLQKQGVINFCVSKQGNYTFCPSIFSRALNQQCKFGVAVDKIGDTDQQKTLDPVDKTNITVTTVSKVFSKSNRVLCSKCQSICGILWYKKKQQSDKNTFLCFECFQNLPEGEAQEYQKQDIVKKIESGAQDNKAVWSIDDNLKLLNFVSKPTKTWQTLQNSFQKKKPFDDIMLQFMQFPICNFDPLQGKMQQFALQDKPETHVQKLVQRLKNSAYGDQKIQQKQAQDLNAKQFVTPMMKLTKSLCNKYSQAIETNLKMQNEIQKGSYEISLYKTIFNKKIRNQQFAPQSEEQENKKSEFQEQSQSSNSRNEQEINENEQEIQQNQENNIKDEQFQQLINNFSYN